MWLCPSLLFPEQPTPFPVWASLFSSSTAVHFANFLTATIADTRDPRHSAYAVLGPRYCPRAYHSDNNF